MYKSIPFHFSVAFAVVAAISVAAVTIAKPTGFDPDAACVGNQRLVAFALAQYVQDFDEQLPDMQTAPAFDTELAPYTQGSPSNALVCPATGAAYTPNASLSYQHFYSFSDMSKIEIIKDTSPHPDGAITQAFLDQHVDQNGAVQGDPKEITRQNAVQLALGLGEYTQDWDGQFPPMQNQAVFEAAVYSYVDDSAYFISPDSGQAFTPNSALSHTNNNSIQDLSTIEELTDGAGTTVYTDSHIEQIGWQPNVVLQSQHNLQQIGFAVSQYTQDYDEYLPLMNSYSEFENETYPYTHNSAIYTEPGTDLPYVLNTSLSGESIANIEDPTATVLIHDPVLDASGALSTGYADGHVQNDYYYLPSGLTIGPTGQPALVWASSEPLDSPTPKYTGSIWDLNVNGNVTSKLSYTYGASFGTLTQVATLHGDSRMILWSGEGGVVNLQAVGSGGTTAQSITGPFDGWQAVGVASRQSNTRVLLKRYDGEVALWTVSSTGSYLRSATFTAPSGETPIALAVGAAGMAYILFSESDGSADIWTLSGKGVVQAQQHYTTSGATQSIAGFTLGGDGLIRLLFDDQNGTAEVHTLNSSGNTTSSFTVQQGGNAIPAQIVVNSAGNVFLLWKYMQTGQGTVLDKLQPNGALVYSKSFMPYM